MWIAFAVLTEARLRIVNGISLTEILFFSLSWHPNKTATWD